MDLFVLIYRNVDELHCDCNAQISSLNLFIVSLNFFNRSLYITVCSCTLFLDFIIFSTVVFLIRSSKRHILHK